MRLRIVIGIICFILLLMGDETFGQDEINSSEMNFQYGVSLKLNVEFALIEGETLPIWHFSLNGGVASNFLTEEIHPSLNGEIQLYNGGLGSARPGIKRPRWNLDFVTALTLTAGRKNVFTSSYDPERYDNIPLYYFSNFSYPSLRNPYRNSISLGTNLIFTTNPAKDHQRVGFFNIHVGRVQVSYYNDGGIPFYQTFLGDRRDRYYTGGGLISYHGESHTICNLVELAYNKFTGYSKNAFEASNLLDLSFVNYRDEKQRNFNKSQISLTAGNPHEHWGGSVILNNYIVLDAQHWIHWFLYDSYHISPYQDFISLVPITYYTYSKVGLR